MRLFLLILCPALAAAAPSVGTFTMDINEQAAGWAGAHVSDGVYEIRSNTLAFTRADFEHYAGGSIQLDTFALLAVPGTLQLEMNGGYFLEKPQLIFVNGRLYVDNMNVRYGSLVIGRAHIEVQQDPPIHTYGNDPCPTNFGPVVNVALTLIDELETVAYEAGVRAALTFGTQIMNIGPYDVPWFWAMAPAPGNRPIIGQHPYLVMHFYRVMDGALSQIGRSDVKHAFFSGNEICNCAGAQIIFTGCVDTYPAYNNVLQEFFGPRHEITAHTAAWTSLGSHFDGDPTNNVRNHFGEGDGFTHLLVVRDADLAFTNAQYFAEAWYVIQNDTNIFDTMGYRRATPVFTNSTWNFTFNTTLQTGSVLSAWASPTNISLLDTGEGHLQVATTTTNLTNGLYRYCYALMNHDFDRQIRSFSVPMPFNILATNFSFYDGDAAATNDWSATVSNGAVTWAAGGTNGLDWGVLHSFSFDANLPPESGVAKLGILESGTNDTLAAGIRAPHAPLAGIQAGPEILWNSVSGFVYQLQTAGGITSAWINVNEPVTAASANLSMVETNDAATQKFYRVLLTP